MQSYLNKYTRCSDTLKINETTIYNGIMPTREKWLRIHKCVWGDDKGV